MKRRFALPFVLLGVITLILLTSMARQTASAQDLCYDAQHPNGFPCPEQPEEEKEEEERPPVIYPSFTPTATLTSTQTATSTPTKPPTPTSTNTPTPTITSTPTLIFGVFASGPAQGLGGFTCPPYAGSIPLGAGAILLGLWILGSRARIPRSLSTPSSVKGSKGFSRTRHAGEGVQGQAQAAMKAAEEDEASSVLYVLREFIVAIVTAVIAVVVAIYSGGQNLMVLMMAVFKISLKERKVSTAAKRDAKSLELSMDHEHLQHDNDSIEQGMAEAQEKADQSMEAASTGLLTGIVGGVAQIASGLLSFGNQGPGTSVARWVGTCVTGMGAGILGSALFGGLLGFDCLSTYLVLPSGAAFGLLSAIMLALLSKTQGGEGIYPIFEPIGPVQVDGSKTGNAGSYKGKDLE